MDEGEGVPLLFSLSRTHTHLLFKLWGQNREAGPKVPQQFCHSCLVSEQLVPLFKGEGGPLPLCIPP